MVSPLDRLYYEKELEYLVDQGRVFSERYPEIARYLNLQGAAAGTRDPHAERIVEAFAFLTGKLQRFIDARFPELVHSLFHMVYPNYLQPLPCKTLARFEPQRSMLDKPVEIKAGTELYAEHQGPDKRRYTFTTSWDILVQPIRLEKVYEDPIAPGDYTLSLVLKTDPGASPENCQWDQLEFTIHGEPTVCHELFLQLAENLEGISVKGHPLATINLVWSGFQPDHGYAPQTRSRYDAFAFLRDYFDAPQRFLFFRLEGINDLAITRKLNEIQIDFRFRKPFATGVHVKPEHLDLYCCVASNLFRKDCEPFKVDSKHLEFALVPDSEHVDLEVYDLESVTASEGRVITPVRPYFRFERSHVDLDRQWFYALRRDQAMERGWDLYIRFLDLNHEGPGALEGQVISPTSWCTNKHYAQDLAPGKLNRVSNLIPETIHVKNITQATVASWPPLHSKNEWDFMAHLALDFAELDNLEAVKTLLGLYHYTKSESGARRIKGVLGVKSESDYEIHRGCCLHGRQLSLELDSSHFSSSGDAALFARVFGHFLQAYCPINGFIRLTVKDRETGYSWHHTARG